MLNNISRCIKCGTTLVCAPRVIEARELYHTSHFVLMRKENIKSKL